MKNCSSSDPEIRAQIHFYLEQVGKMNEVLAKTNLKQKVFSTCPMVLGFLKKHFFYNGFPIEWTNRRKLKKNQH